MTKNIAFYVNGTSLERADDIRIKITSTTRIRSRMRLLDLRSRPKLRLLVSAKRFRFSSQTP